VDGSSILQVKGLICWKARFGVDEVWGDLDFIITGEGSSLIGDLLVYFFYVTLLVLDIILGF